MFFLRCQKCKDAACATLVVTEGSVTKHYWVCVHCWYSLTPRENWGDIEL
jgi:hypothetical protein